MMSQRRLECDSQASGVSTPSAASGALVEKFKSAMLTYLGFNVTKLTAATKY
jgi:hypothetical protein